MKSPHKRWQNHWSNRLDSGHRNETDEWLHFYAKELILYFPPMPVLAIELGCGNGALYPFFKECFLDYIGIDFSWKMLSVFKARCPDVNLVCSDACCIPIGNKQPFDLIFSNGICQYLSRPLLMKHLAQTYSLLSPTGMVLIGNIPDAQLRWLYYAGALRGDQDSLPWYLLGKKLARYGLSVLLGKFNPDGIGHWYSRRDIFKIAEESGFSCQTYSSASYEYRFHAILRKQSSTSFPSVF